MDDFFSLRIGLTMARVLYGTHRSNMRVVLVHLFSPEAKIYAQVTAHPRIKVGGWGNIGRLGRSQPTMVETKSSVLRIGAVRAILEAFFPS